MQLLKLNMLKQKYSNSSIKTIVSALLNWIKKLNFNTFFSSIKIIVIALFRWIKQLNFRGVGTDDKPLMVEEVEAVKWISLGTKRKANQKAKDKANAAKWNLESAIFLFAVLFLVIILTTYTKAGITLVTLTAILGLTAVWVVGWRRSRQLYRRFYHEELTQCPDEWKDYYKILRISPSAKSETIDESYQRLSIIFKEVLSDKTRSKPTYSIMLREINEAYEVLSNNTNRINYDRMFWLKYNAGVISIDTYTKSELVALSESISQQMAKSARVVAWRKPIFSGITGRVIRGVVIALLVILLGGTSFALVNPEHVIAAPFRGIAATVAKATVGTIELLEGVRGIAGNQERKIVSTALQSMRVNEGVQFVPPVTMPTNDMASFPASECCLFPDYLETRYSQFRYTVNSNGNVVIDTSWATTDSFVDNVKKLIIRLEN